MLLMHVCFSQVTKASTSLVSVSKWQVGDAELLLLQGHSGGSNPGAHFWKTPPFNPRRAGTVVSTGYHVSSHSGTGKKFCSSSSSSYSQLGEDQGCWFLKQQANILPVSVCQVSWKISHRHKWQAWENMCCTSRVRIPGFATVHVTKFGEIG